MRTIVSLLLCLFAIGVARADSAERSRFGLQVALAVEQGNLFGSGPSSHTRLAMFQPQMSVALLRRGESPLVELVNEITFAESLSPSRRLIMSVNEGLRYHVRPTRPSGWYMELGAGIGSSALHVNPNDGRPLPVKEFRQLDAWLQYHLQLGGGMRFNIGKQRLQAGYRLTHFSNNGTTKPNRGLNMHTFVLNWQLRPL